MNDALSVFVDADAFVALAKDQDSHHDRALKLLDRLIGHHARFITSNYVIAESITVISQRVGHANALQFIEQIKSEQNIFLVHWITPQIEEHAIAIFKKQSSKNVSFVDCTNMAILSLLHIDAIFSFDGIYQHNGYTTTERYLR